MALPTPARAATASTVIPSDPSFPEQRQGGIEDGGIGLGFARAAGGHPAGTLTPASRADSLSASAPRDGRNTAATTGADQSHSGRHQNGVAHPVDEGGGSAARSKAAPASPIWDATRAAPPTESRARSAAGAGSAATTGAIAAE